MQSAWKRIRYGFALRVLRAWTRPLVGGLEDVRDNIPAAALEAAQPPGEDAAGQRAAESPGAVVYALANRSLADILLLDLIAERNGLPSPLAPLPQHDEARRFFFLNRPPGL